MIEILSEHTCQGMLQSYTLTGRTGLFPTYESFLGIVHTMVVQYSKFVKMHMVRFVLFRWCFYSSHFSSFIVVYYLVCSLLDRLLRPLVRHPHPLANDL